MPVSRTIPDSHTDQSDGRTEDDVQAAQIVVELIEAAHRLREILSAHLAEFGLTITRYEVIKAIGLCLKI